MSESSPTLAMRRLAQAQRILTYLAVALAAIAAAYLLFTLLSEHEVCYGMRADKLLCQPVDAMAAARGALVLLFPGVLMVGAAVGALWGLNAKAPDHRSTAYGLLVTSDVVLIGIVAPALDGAGFFLVPATVVMTIVAILATIAFIHDWRAGLAQAG
ncbi:MAG: hypothetical protein KGO05_16635 [Chloroflexota bacterium]|nr:hypothetical protein [Chloroflexota bacterium]